MRADLGMLTAILLSGALMCGCGGGSGNNGGGVGPPPAAPIISTTPAQNGALIVTLTDATPDVLINYTVDGTAPTPSSQQYQAPFLVATNLTVNAIATSGASRAITVSTVTSQTFTFNFTPGVWTLVWSDEFTSSSSTPAQPNPLVWTYDTGTDCCGNNELEDYCAWGSTDPNCSSTSPSAYVAQYPGTDGVLYIKAQQPSAGVYTSARLKTQGLFSFQYGRIEFRALVP